MRLELHQRISHPNTGRNRIGKISFLICRHAVGVNQAKRQVLGGSKAQQERRPDIAKLKIPGDRERDKNKKQYNKSPLPINYRRLVKGAGGALRRAEPHGVYQHSVAHRKSILRPDDTEDIRNLGRRSAKWCRMTAGG